MLTDEEIMTALTKDDKKIINKTLEDSMEEKKYQITYMNGPLNITLRLDSRERLVEELELTLQEARKSSVLNAKVSVAPATGTPDAMAGQKCEKCGASMLLSKKGNWYCSEKCWLN